MSTPRNSFDLAGRHAVVTGGSRGIGFAIARGLAQAGASISIASRDVERCLAAAEAINQLGCDATAMPCDVARTEDIDRVFSAIERCDILVHCAGSAYSEFAATTSAKLRSKMLDVHFHGGVECAQRAYQKMKGHGGSILLVGSVWGLGGASGTLAYGSAKAALIHSAKVMAIEWARDGIRVNALVPGFVETEMTRDVPQEARAKMLSRIPMRRAAKPEELVGPALFLASDAASFVTGHVLVADGGERAR